MHQFETLNGWGSRLPPLGFRGLRAGLGQEEGGSALLPGPAGGQAAVESLMVEILVDTPSFAALPGST